MQNSEEAEDSEPGDEQPQPPPPAAAIPDGDRAAPVSVAIGPSPSETSSTSQSLPPKGIIHHSHSTDSDHEHHKKLSKKVSYLGKSGCESLSNCYFLRSNHSSIIHVYGAPEFLAPTCSSIYLWRLGCTPLNMHALEPERRSVSPVRVLKQSTNLPKRLNREPPKLRVISCKMSRKKIAKHLGLLHTRR